MWAGARRHGALLCLCLCAAVCVADELAEREVVEYERRSGAKCQVTGPCEPCPSGDSRAACARTGHAQPIACSALDADAIDATGDGAASLPVGTPISSHISCGGQQPRVSVAFVVFEFAVALLYAWTSRAMNRQKRATESEFDRRKRCGGADETGTAGAQVELRKMVDGSSDTARLLNKV